MSPELEVIEQWIDVAAREQMGKHKRHFWTVREVLEGKDVDQARRQAAVEFLRSCKQSRELTILLEAMGG